MVLFPFTGYDSHDMEPSSSGVCDVISVRGGARRGDLLAPTWAGAVPEAVSEAVATAVAKSSAKAVSRAMNQTGADDLPSKNVSSMATSSPSSV